MATKANPGQYDVYEKAAMDEPLFTLRAKDPVAPWLVRAWVALRAGDLETAQAAMAIGHSIMGELGPDLDMKSAKAQEAYQCAHAMEEWRLANVN